MKLLPLLFLSMLVAACGQTPVPSVTPSGSPTVSAEPSASVEPSVPPTESPPPTTPEPTLPAEPVSVVLKGAGTETTDEFPLPDGNYVVSWRVTDGPCTADFTLLQPDYHDRYPVGHAATNDTTDGQFRVALPGGWYKLEVKDPGCKWTVTVVQQ